MPVLHINLWAVLVAALIQVVIGTLWYSKVLFANMWMKLVNIGPEDMKKGMTKSIVGAIVVALITSYVLAHIVGYSLADTAYEGLQAGFWVWLGFVATSTSAQVLFDRRPVKLYLLNNGFNLVSLLLMGVVLAMWQ